MKELNIRCSVIGLAAEVRICRKLCTVTQGTFLMVHMLTIQFIC